MPAIAMGIAEVYAHLRQMRGLTEDQKAADFGPYRKSWFKMEARTQDVRRRGVVDLAREFGITVDQLDADGRAVVIRRINTLVSV